MTRALPQSPTAHTRKYMQVMTTVLVLSRLWSVRLPVGCSDSLAVGAVKASYMRCSDRLGGDEGKIQESMMASHLHREDLRQ